MKFNFYLFRTLRARVIGLVIGIIIFISLLTLLFVQNETEDTFFQSNDNYSQTLVNYLWLNVSDQYKSIQFHKQTVLDLRKKGLKDQTEIACHVLDKYYKQQQNGILKKAEAQKLAAQEISQIRFNDDVGYFWINDMQQPYPTMIVHTTLPELNGKVLDNERFNCALGKNENLFKAFVDVCMLNGEGYVDYFWPKPTVEGLSEDQPKLSYVKAFKPWQWVIGTGIYIDDVNREVENRVNAVVDDLNEGVGNLNTNNRGYVFIFNGASNVLVHPYSKNIRLLDAINTATGNNLFDDLIVAYNKGTNYIDYNWIKAMDTVNYVYKKRAYISYFEPLDWYIVSSYYLEQIEQPIKSLSKKIALLTFIFLIISISISVILANTITKPINELSNAVVDIERNGISDSIKDIKGSYEIVKFRDLLNTMITSVKVSQEDLINSRSKLQQYIEYAPDGIFILDSDSIILNCNRQAFSILKLPAAELINKKLLSFVNDNDKGIFLAVLSKIADSGAGEVEVPFFDKNGEIIHTLFSGSLISTGEIIAFIKDIGPIKKYQNELFEAKQKAEESNKLKTAFLANMSHEIRTPMNGVVGFTQLLSDPELSKEDRLKYSDIISNSSMQLLRIVNDIVDISKIEAGIVNLELEEILITDFLSSIEQTHSQAAKDLGLDFIIEAHENANYSMRGYFKKLRQVLDNLISNALKFTASGSIKIGFKASLKEYSFYVSDTGIGLSKEDQGIIFDRFTQAKTNYSAQNGGTGLGLAISKAYIELMNGTLLVESELNQGSTFYFNIPKV